MIDIGVNQRTVFYCNIFDNYDVTRSIQSIFQFLSGCYDGSVIENFVIFKYGGVVIGLVDIVALIACLAVDEEAILYNNIEAIGISVIDMVAT